MRAEHYLVHVLGIAPKLNANVCAQWMITLKLATDRSQAVVFMSYFVFWC